ncbi:hypothetical protein RHSIM_Rhsim01G0126400 [Rhododendron simsii]|uniref:Uncharacterized protein n=1 Tax=Rhododendron simsii TaxID=118357 RepID=A0A834HJP7_RHOSS|nr:hypothetical protein RHSIM_Rhsim01G0126400 [Rhododendron simsii]
MGMVVLTLRYFAGPDVPRYVLFTVEYTWLCSLSIIILVPADICTTIIGREKWRNPFLLDVVTLEYLNFYLGRGAYNSGVFYLGRGAYNSGMLDCWAGTLAKLVLGLGMDQLAAAVG